jgi:hypothetical protein
MFGEANIQQARALYLIDQGEAVELACHHATLRLVVRRN